MRRCSGPTPSSGESSPEGMVAPPENPGAFQRQDVGGRLDDAEFSATARLVPAEGTLLLFGEESAKAAGTKGFPGPSDGAGQLLGLGIGGAEHPEGDPLGTARTDARQTSQLPHQLSEGFGIVERHGKLKMKNEK